MICSKCRHWRQRETPVRMSPTFYHSPIFDTYEGPYPSNPRCSATYHSTVFDGIHQHQPKQPSKCCCKHPQKTTYQTAYKQKKTSTSKAPLRCSSACKFQRQTDLHPQTQADLNRLSGRGVTHHDLLWFNPDKEVRLMNCSNCYHHGLPRERKLIQLESDPFHFQTCNCQVRVEVMRDSCQYVPQCRCGPECQCGSQCECGSQCCCVEAANTRKVEQINNDSLDIINQNKKLIETRQPQSPTFGQPQQIPLPYSQQVEQLHKIQPSNKKQNRHTKICRDPYAAKQPNNDSKLNTINCNKTLKKSNPKGPAGQPMFWAVTKSNLKR